MNSLTQLPTLRDSRSNAPTFAPVPALAPPGTSTVTSNIGATECFVYLMLPGATSFVTAARFALEPDRNGVPLGRFVYAKSYPARPEAIPIDPVELKLGTQTYQNRRLQGVFGALRQELLLDGTSMGGARPKTVVEGDDALWNAKLNRADDEWNSARVEHAMLLLAKECGIAVASSRVEKVGDRDTLLVRRFAGSLPRQSWTRRSSSAG